MEVRRPGAEPERWNRECLYPKARVAQYVRTLPPCLRNPTTKTTRHGKKRPMKFGMFYEHQLPRPWTQDSERRLYQEALEQVELADRIGIDYV
jgi:hypothetical protein